jgi:hypothetical protein
MWWNRTAFRESFPAAADRLFASGEAPPTVVIYVDAWTAYGGSQFVDSPGTGRYHTYLCDEVVPWVDERYRTIAAAEHRGISGKSSGGYGAMVVPMLRPDVFGALASHAGDALFEACYLPEFPAVARQLRDHFEGGFATADDSAFIDRFHAAAVAEEHQALSLVGDEGEIAGVPFGLQRLHQAREADER